MGFETTQGDVGCPGTACAKTLSLGSPKASMRPAAETCAKRAQVQNWCFLVAEEPCLASRQSTSVGLTAGEHMVGGGGLSLAGFTLWITLRGPWICAATASGTEELPCPDSSQQKFR